MISVNKMTKTLVVVDRVMTSFTAMADKSVSSIFGAVLYKYVEEAILKWIGIGEEEFARNSKMLTTGDINI